MHVKLYALTRLKNSVNGNARWRLDTSEGSFLTAIDSMIAVGITNGNPVGKAVELTLTHYDRVIDMKIIDEEL